MAFFTDDWIPFVCSTDVSIQISATKTAVRTRGDGPWKKYTYQDVSFSITLAGLLKFDDENFSGWDLLNNQLGFTQVLCRISFDDQNGNVRTVQGNVMIEASTLSFSPGTLVKDDFSLQGSGSLIVFDGLIPCDTAISTITVDGQEAADGTISVSYTYTGDVYQVKYRIDNTGDYVYALVGSSLVIPGLAIGNHSVEIIPVCANGYEGTGATQSFSVTQALVCSSSIDGYFIHTGNSALFSNLDSGVSVIQDSTSNYILPHIIGSATLYAYEWAGSGIWTTVPVGTPIPLSGLSVGAQQLSLVPICQFLQGQVQGSGITRGFTLLAQPSQSAITFTYVNEPPGNTLSIYVNGIQLVACGTANSSGSFTAPIGAVVKAVLATTQPRTCTLRIVDSTTSAIIYNESDDGPTSLTYSFVANGDSYNINATASP